MTHHDTAKLLDYHAWANERIFECLAQLPQDACDAKLTSVFPSVAETLAHMYLFDRLWLAVLEEIPNSDIFPQLPVWSAEAQGKTAEELRRKFADVAGMYRAWVERTPDPEREIAIEPPHYGKMDTRLSEIVRHVANHGTYHRGNIAAMLRQQGYEGIATDYIFYLRDSKS